MILFIDFLIYLRWFTKLECLDSIDFNSFATLRSYSSFNSFLRQYCGIRLWKLGWITFTNKKLTPLTKPKQKKEMTWLIYLSNRYSKIRFLFSYFLTESRIFFLWNMHIILDLERWKTDNWNRRFSVVSIRRRHYYRVLTLLTSSTSSKLEKRKKLNKYDFDL